MRIEPEDSFVFNTKFHTNQNIICDALFKRTECFFVSFFYRKTKFNFRARFLNKVKIDKLIDIPV